MNDFVCDKHHWNGNFVQKRCPLCKMEEESEARMSDVADIEEHRPHMVILTDDGNAHVVPESVISKIANGEMPLMELDDWEPIIRKILSEWKLNLEEIGGAW